MNNPCAVPGAGTVLRRRSNEPSALAVLGSPYPSLMADRRAILVSLSEGAVADSNLRCTCGISVGAVPEDLSADLSLSVLWTSTFITDRGGQFRCLAWL